jgi:putative ABC transport system permease protein
MIRRRPFGPSRERLEDDLRRELAYHVERRMHDLMKAGLTETDARRRAAIELGGVTQVQENVRDTWIWRGLDELVRDVRHAARSLRRSWGFALGAGAVLALGIGANTAMFSVVNVVLLEPLDYPNADRIVAVETLWTNTGQTNPNVSGPDFLDWQAQNSVFEVLAHSAGEDEMATTVNGRGGFGNLRSVSPDFFAVFGRPAAAGRLLTARDTPTPQQGPTGRQTNRASLLPAVVGYSWAAANFGSAEGAVGKTFLLYRAPVEIVGVATPGFQYPDATNIWIPSGPTNRTNRDAQNYRAIGRLQPGVTLAAAQAQMRVVGGRLAAEYTGNRFKNISLIPLQQRLTENVQGTLWMLMGAVTLTLLIGCANIANLLLARSANRTREMALRAALGAGRARLVRQLLTESSVLAGLAAGAGVFLAHILVQGIVTLSPANLPRVEEIRIDGTALMFALGLSAASILLFSLLPALKAARLNLSETLKQGGAKGTVSGGSRLRAALVVTEVALSVLLLAGAGLLLRSFQQLHQEELGFTTDRVVTAYTQYALGEGRTRPIRAAFYRDLLERVRALPGVVAASGVSVLPLGREQNAPADFFIEGQPAGRPGERPQALSLSVATDYFKTLNIPFRLGRDFSDADTPDSPRVIVVNESLARSAFPGKSAVGGRIGTTPNGPWMEIVGVVADSRWRNPSLPPQPEYFNASGQGVGGSLTILARTSVDEGSVARALRALLEETDPTVPVRIETMEDIFESALAYPRFRTQLTAAFGGMALLLSALGIFSVLAYLVGQRTRELAVRRAVGAGSADVIRLVVGQGLRLLAFGLLLGVASALVGSRLLTGLLYETSPWDFITYASVVGVLTVAATLAMLLPAIRATAIDPLIALRHE